MLPRTPTRRRHLTAPILALALIVVSALQAGAVTTYSRTVGSSGHASMYPSGVDVDTNGDVYVADTGNDMVKKFLAGSTTPVWTVGVRGQTMQNGSFSNPRDVAVGANYVYVADTDNLVVQVLSKQTGAFIQTLPFTFKSPIGVSVGTDGSGHELVLASDGGSGNVEVFAYDAATSTHFDHVASVPPKLGVNAGTRDAATNAAGALFVADYRHNVIHKYTVSGTLPNLVYTWSKQWGGSGAPTPLCQQIPRPYGVDVDDAGNIYVAASDTNVIREFDANGNCIAGGTYGASGSTNDTLSQLRRVAVGPGPNPIVYAADVWGLKVLSYNSAGSHTVPIGILGGRPYPADGLLNEPHSVAISTNGNTLYVTDTINQRAQRFDLTTCSPVPSPVCPAVSWGDKGVGTGSFNWPQGIAVNPANGHVWVADTRNNRLQEYAADGTGPLQVVGGAQGTANNQFYWPMSLTFDPAGNMYVADTFNNRIQAYNAKGTYLWTYPGVGATKLKRPFGITYDAFKKRLLVVDTMRQRVLSISTAGAKLATLIANKPAGLPGSAPGQLNSPCGIAVDPVTGNIWIADTNNNRIEEFATGGHFLNVIGGTAYGSGSTQFNSPMDLVFDATGSRLFVADTYNDRIQVFTP